MRIYQLYEGNTPIAPQIEVWMDMAPRHDLNLPLVHCDACERGGGTHDIPIPEGLPDDHPLLRRLRQHYRRFRRALSEVNGQYVELDNEYRSHGQTIPEDHPIHHQMTTAGRLTPEEFRQLASELRQALCLPPEREIVPWARFGPLHLRYYYSPLPDINWANGDRDIVVRERTLQVLREAGLTGWRAYPVASATYRGRLPAGPPPPLYELIIEGRAGLPKGVRPEDIERCARCGSLIRTKVMPTLELDPANWDGSDFFYFEYDRRRFVTERVKEAFEAADLEEVGLKDPNAPTLHPHILAELTAYDPEDFEGPVEPVEPLEE